MDEGRPWIHGASEKGTVGLVSLVEDMVAVVAAVVERGGGVLKGVGDSLQCF